MKKQLNKIIKLLEEINSKLPQPTTLTFYPSMTICGGCGMQIFGDRCYVCNPVGTVEGDFGYEYGG